MFNMQPCLREFVKEAGIARALENAGAERAVHFNGGTDHDLARFVRLHERVEMPSVSFVSFVLSQR